MVNVRYVAVVVQVYQVLIPSTITELDWCTDIKFFCSKTYVMLSIKTHLPVVLRDVFYKSRVKKNNIKTAEWQ